MPTSSTVNPYLTFDGTREEVMRCDVEAFGADPQILRFRHAA